MEVDWNGNLVWKAEAPYQNHDFQVIHDEHVIYMSWHPKGNLPELSREAIFSRNFDLSSIE
ncbi:hypothetical protein ES703_114700 [subsurface metagenome]